MGVQKAGSSLAEIGGKFCIVIFKVICHYLGMADKDKIYGQFLKRVVDETKAPGKSIWMDIPKTPQAQAEPQQVPERQIPLNQAGLDRADKRIMEAPTTYEELMLDMKNNPQKYQNR